jgi:hypothetical protein
MSPTFLFPWFLLAKYNFVFPAQIIIDHVQFDDVVFHVSKKKMEGRGEGESAEIDSIPFFVDTFRRVQRGLAKK